jgi:diaminopimelate epimerase
VTPPEAENRARAVLAFTKVEGLGNDFLLLDRVEASIEAVERELDELRAAAPRLCDRRRGVGADGILVVGPARCAGSHATMWVVNHDGSRPQMCGNGLRCVGLWLARRPDAPGRTLRVDTDAGLKTCEVTDLAGGWVEVDMGPGRAAPPVTPAAGDGRAFTRVSTGNPHAIAFVAPDEDPEALARRLGPVVEVDPVFEEGTNVELARLEPAGPITLWVWERGCGITHACGTGACATAFAAVQRGDRPAGQPIEVRLPGGPLSIEVPEDPEQGIRMAGPARIVFEGTI